MNNPAPGTYWKNTRFYDIYIVVLILDKKYLVNTKTGGYYSSFGLYGESVFGDDENDFVQVEVELSHKELPPPKVTKEITFRKLGPDEIIPAGAFFSYNEMVTMNLVTTEVGKIVKYYQVSYLSFWVMDDNQ